MRKLSTIVAAFALTAGTLATPAQAVALSTSKIGTTAAGASEVGASVKASTVGMGGTVRFGAVKAGPVRYDGSCPASTEFTATVSVKGVTRFTYRWLRSDGTRGAVRTARAGAAVKLRERRTFDATTTGWQAVQVLSPRRATSRRAHFAVTCGGAALDATRSDSAAPPATATAKVSGDSHAGACPATLTFTGTVRVSRVPAAVAYRWVDSDGGALATEHLWFAGGTKSHGSAARRVTSSRTFLASQTGTRWIEILGPGGRVLSSSDKAAYRVACAATPQPPQVVVKAADPWVSPTGYQGTCTRPLEFTFHANVSATKPVKVSYVWIRGDGTKYPGQVTLTKDDLLKDVAHTWRVADPTATSGGSARLLITSPGQARTEPVTFSIRCVRVTVSEVKVVSPAQPYSGPCPVVVRTTATVTVTGGPLSVWQRWRGAPVSSEVISGSRTFTSERLVRETSTGETAFSVAAFDDYGHEQEVPVRWAVTCKAGEPGKVSVSPATITSWSRDPGPCTTANPYQFTVAATVTPPEDADFPLRVSYRWRWDDGGYWHEEDMTLTGPGAKRVAHTWSTFRSKAAKVWLDLHAPVKVAGEAVGYSVTCDGKPPAPVPGGKVVSVTAPAITPAAHHGPCPVDLKAVATITVSAPTQEPVQYVWRFDNGTTSPTEKVDFPEGGPLTKTVERKDWRAVASTGKVTGYLQILTPNTAVSTPVSYTVTCT